MNNFKKIGLSALAGSLVATSAFAGEISVAGSASLNMEHTNGGAADTGKTFSMGNQLTFSGSGELDNGLNVSLSFILDQGDEGTAGSQATSPFDSHSVTISSDSLGSLKFSGEGGSSATSALDTTAAGDIWDSFDDSGAVTPTGVGTGANMMMYTLPSVVDGAAINVSFLPSGSATDSAVGYSLTYTGVEGLSASWGTGDGTNTTTDATAMKASYAYGPLTVAWSNYEYDATGTSADNETTSYKLSYTVSDALSVSYGQDTVEEGTSLDGEYTSINASYTTGGMTISAAMQEAENIDGTSTATEDRERWALGASFAF
jgi:outer membrane protein OmpU